MVAKGTLVRESVACQLVMTDVVLSCTGFYLLATTAFKWPRRRVRHCEGGLKGGGVESQYISAVYYGYLRRRGSISKRLFIGRNCCAPIQHVPRPCTNQTHFATLPQTPGSHPCSRPYRALSSSGVTGGRTHYSARYVRRGIRLVRCNGWQGTLFSKVYCPRRSRHVMYVQPAPSVLKDVAVMGSY
jgi:hypothetical protein